MKKETKSKDAPKEHKQPWQEKYATPEDIKRMLADRVMLRYNEVRGRTEIHWLSQGPTIREDEQGLLTIFAEDGGVTDGYIDLDDREVNTLWEKLYAEKPLNKKYLQDIIESNHVVSYLLPPQLRDYFYTKTNSGMSAASVRSNAYRHHIPTKRKFGQTYYSKDHFEQLRRTDIVNDDRYYTAREAAEKYGMSTANIGIIAKKNSIATIKVGVKNLIPKADFDRIMAERLVQYGSYSLV